MQSYHKKKVNEVIYDEEDKMLISCSNDGTVRVKDLKSRTIIKEFKRKDEIYSISKSKHILCGGSEDGCITFWDLKTMKER
jgi:WD40 repeat protein